MRRSVAGNRRRAGGAAVERGLGGGLALALPPGERVGGAEDAKQKSFTASARRAWARASWACQAMPAEPQQGPAPGRRSCRRASGGGDIAQARATNRPAPRPDGAVGAVALQVVVPSAATEAWKRSRAGCSARSTMASRSLCILAAGRGLARRGTRAGRLASNGRVSVSGSKEHQPEGVDIRCNADRPPISCSGAA